MTKPTSRRPDAGFTLVEAVLALTFLMPVLLGIVQLTGGLSRTVTTNAAAAQTQGLLQRAFQGLSKFTQAAKLSTLRMQAVQEDIDMARATTLGEWIDPTEGVWRPGVQFVSASGLRSMNAMLNTSTRQVVFTRDGGEFLNSLDDDGDGLVDEGEIVLLHEGSRVAVLRDVESCEFNLSGRLLELRIAVAQRLSDGRIERARMERAIYLRNN